MGTLLGNALARAGLVTQKQADRVERELQMRRAAEKANQPPDGINVNDRPGDKESPEKEKEDDAGEDR